MILIIPEVEIKNGECTELIRGESGTENLYLDISRNPKRLCDLFRRENAKTIHVTDLDSFENSGANYDLIMSISRSLDIPISIFSNFKSKEDCTKYLDDGIYRLILKELPLYDPDTVRELIKIYTASRFAFFFDGAGKIETLPDGSEIDYYEFRDNVKSIGGNRIVYHDSNWNNKAIDFEELTDIAAPGIRITIYGGIRTPQELWTLDEMLSFGLDSVIMKKALYENDFPCQNIWRIAEADLEPHEQKQKKEK